VPGAALWVGCSRERALPVVLLTGQIRCLAPL
jgi:hypothetical protein